MVEPSMVFPFPGGVMKEGDRLASVPVARYLERTGVGTNDRPTGSPDYSSKSGERPR
jgi:hypothetical protein